MIDHQEESRLALLGCHSFIDPEKPFTLLFDIGGGSTEILWIANDGVTGTSRGQSFVSLPYGVVGVAETHTPTMAGNYRRVVSMVQQALDPFASRHDIDHYIAHNQVQLLGTSGTATTAAVLFLGLNRYERKKNAGITLSFDDLYRSIQHLHMILSSDHAHHYHLGSSRADLMMAGLAILEGICDTFQVGFLTATDRGVREGIIADLQRRRSSDAAPRYKGGTVGNDDAPIPRVVGF